MSMCNSGEKFVLERDGHGYACAISYDGIWIIHLNVGTTRNETFAQWLVDKLNGNDSPMPDLNDN